MKILITTGIFEPESGGPATYTPQIAQKLVEAGYEVKVVTYSDKAQYDFDKEYSFALQRIVRRGKLSNYWRFFKVMMKDVRHYDLVYSLDWLAAGLPVSLATRFWGKRYVLRIGGGYIWEKYLQQGNNPVILRDFYSQGLHKGYKVLLALISFVFKGAQHIIFNSKEQRELFLEYYHFSAGQTSTIFNPVPQNIWNIRRTQPTREIVFAGRFVVMKNVEALIRAFKQANLEGFTLFLIGSGPQKEKIISLVSELDLEDRVTMSSSMRRSDLYERIKNCYYAVIPSWTDISPNQAYEMMALKIPFLMTQENYLSVSDQLPLTINPNLVEDIAGKMERLTDEQEYRDFIRGLEKVTFNHTWDDVLRQHVEIFKRITVAEN